MEYSLSRHAEDELMRRRIPREKLDELLPHPQQVLPGHGGRTILQSQFPFAGGKTFLLRAVVDQRLGPATVVTVYRTTRIARYWQQA